MENHYIECACVHPEHMLKFTYDDEDYEFYVSTLLARTNIFNRVWIAIKYVLGIQSPFGHFAETILRKEHIIQLHKRCSKAIREDNENERRLKDEHKAG